MEENDRRSRERPAAEDSSGSGEDHESNRAILPLLQAPGNHQQPHHHHHHHHNHHHHRITNFYIDNILRPDFGRCIRRKDGTLPAREEERLGVLRTERSLQSSITRASSKTSSGGVPLQPRGGGGGVGGGGEGGSEEDSVSPRSDVTRRGDQAKKAEIVAGDDVPLKPLQEGGDGGGGGGDQCLSSDTDSSQAGSNKSMLWPAWVYCTRYSDRPSSGPRSRKPKKTSSSSTTAATVAMSSTAAATPNSSSSSSSSKDDKRPRTAFTAEQLHRLKTEFQTNRYLTEQRRQSLAAELGLNESQIKIWFQNKRAKIKKATGNKNSLALHLMAQGLYNHATTASSKDGGDKSDSDE